MMLLPCVCVQVLLPHYSGTLAECVSQLLVLLLRECQMEAVQLSGFWKAGGRGSVGPGEQLASHNHSWCVGCSQIRWLHSLPMVDAPACSSCSGADSSDVAQHQLAREVFCSSATVTGNSHRGCCSVNNSQPSRVKGSPVPVGSCVLCAHALHAQGGKPPVCAFNTSSCVFCQSTASLPEPCVCLCTAVACRVAAKVNGCWRLLDPVYALVM